MSQEPLPKLDHSLFWVTQPHCALQTYGFYTECVRKYGSSHVWTYFTDMFDFLTLSVVIDDQIFCVHGGTFSLQVSYRRLILYSPGLSPSIHSIDQIKVVDRFRGAVPAKNPNASVLTTTASSARNSS